MVLDFHVQLRNCFWFAMTGPMSIQRMPNTKNVPVNFNGTVWSIHDRVKGFWQTSKLPYTSYNKPVLKVVALNSILCTRTTKISFSEHFSSLDDSIIDNISSIQNQNNFFVHEIFSQSHQLIDSRRFLVTNYEFSYFIDWNRIFSAQKAYKNPERRSDWGIVLEFHHIMLISPCM